MGYDEQPTDELDSHPAGGTRAGLAEPPLIASGRRLGGRYVLERPVGYGGMAVVWLATDERLGRPVAVKVLSDTLSADHDYLGRFGREARVAAGLQHPNLVSVYDYDAGERPYLVMEYIEGGDLAERDEAGRGLVPEQLAGELLSALGHIHAAGVLHRDIKPQNVLVDRYGHARLSDFGIARPADAASLTRTGEVIGTERYLAPEVIAGEPASERSDLYALGVLLADLAADGAGAALWKLIDELRDPDPARRPASAETALAELERGETRPPAGEPTQPYEPRPFEPTPTGVRAPMGRNRVIALGAVLATALAALALLLIGGGDEGRNRQPVAQAGGGAADSGSRSDSDAGGDHASAPAGSAAADEATTAAGQTPTGGVSGADPAALNDQGFELLGEGRYEEAIPVLERAVEGLRGSGDEATYNYALFNLAGAYLGAGRAADAIPLLEERMQFDDGQLGKVQATLDRAYAAADEKPPKKPKEPKPEKPGKGPKHGSVPPPFEADGE
ncbi:MAG TPA: serine/threonine-protein kinase [Solirubrobacterales bacterium]|jgi:tetratricopeptide (TPR) repeat protein